MLQANGEQYTEDMNIMVWIIPFEQSIFGLYSHCVYMDCTVYKLYSTNVHCTVCILMRILYNCLDICSVHVHNRETWCPILIRTISGPTQKKEICVCVWQILRIRTRHANYANAFVLWTHNFDFIMASLCTHRTYTHCVLVVSNFFRSNFVLLILFCTSLRSLMYTVHYTQVWRELFFSSRRPGLYLHFGHWKACQLQNGI